MLFDFANVLVFTVLGLGFVGVNLLIGKLLRPSNPQVRKLSTYECGEPASGSAWVNFNIRFLPRSADFHHLRSGNCLYFPSGSRVPPLDRERTGAFCVCQRFLFLSGSYFLA